MTLDRLIARVAALVVAIPLAARAGGGPYIGPLPYLSEADNPFPLGTLGFCLENFEDGMLDPGGVTMSGSIIGPGGLTDSVDGDDGTIDGSGTNGRSRFFGNGPVGMTVTFDPQRAGGLPTQAGLVWTDGNGVISFEAFDENGVSLGVYGPFDHADGSSAGTTGEDRFYGVSNAGGISSMRLSNSSGGIEVDHLVLNNSVENCVFVPSTTSTSASSTSTTVTTTSTVTTTITSTSTSVTTSTFTTTTIAAGCAGVPVGPTFESLNCRLASLIAAVQAESQLGKQQAKLDKAAQKAKARKEAAESACAEGDAKAAGKQLKKVVRKLIQFSHRLRSNNARKNIPEEIREPLAETADEIQEDARELKDSLSCAG